MRIRIDLEESLASTFRKKVYLRVFGEFSCFPVAYARPVAPTPNVIKRMIDLCYQWYAFYIYSGGDSSIMSHKQEFSPRRKLPPLAQTRATLSCEGKVELLTGGDQLD